VAKPYLISNTSPLLYLGRLGQAHLLSTLFEKVYIPQQIVLELDAGRLLRSDTIDPRIFPWITIVTVTQSAIDNLPVNRLGQGERAVIAYAQLHSGYIIALDDRQARLLAAQLQIPLIGTLGILLKAKRVGLIPSVRPLLDAVQREGFRMDEALYNQALKLANEES
jgi:predicted nucleic acid-binding protein